ncbi:MAG TPA: lipid-A-disaccharide synthase N-terminal domain-containing protein [Thermoanaerobaculia bacterium]|nr:lipid-A-disaccharide synthase N-terminal domain-containing protein [Thermoanaerobaculia bacterium]
MGLAWVGLGLAGQLLFTGRMLLQWLASERERRSVVPVGFWWLSVAGSTLLVAYFLWRKDLVGVLGQGAGWVIYLRNLWLIYRSEGGLADSQA